jgi:integrase/recombinase XerD
LGFIAGSGPVTWFWRRKCEVLSGFYRFLIARGYVTASPLPKIVPIPPPRFVPYIYSHDELRRLLEATIPCDNPRNKIAPHTLRTLILLLYGAGLRISETLAFTLNDVDFSAEMIQIRESKSYKTRLVPLGPDLVKVLTTYATRRKREHLSRSDATFLISRAGRPIKRATAEKMFSRLRVRAGVLRSDGARYQPRLHDLRHAFAVHRVISWYRQGADVQRLLPQLTTYLGHVHIVSTQRYLTMTPELLTEASKRFELYAWEGTHE